VSHITPSRINRSTCLPHQFQQLPLDGLGLHYAYLHAKELHAARPVPAGVSGYRVFCIFRDLVRSIDLPAKPDVYAVIGRHTQCDVVLDAEPTVALRHLLVRAVPQPDGGVGIHILDLNTSLAFHVDDGGPCRSILAVGAIAVRLGPYAIVALPLEPGQTPPALPKPTLSRAPSMQLAMQQGPYRAPAVRGGGVLRSSHITMLPIAPPLEDLPLGNARTGYGRLTIDGFGRRATVEVSEQDLDLGVLIGRAEKCIDEGLRGMMDISISRAHLLLVREGGITYAFDLSSTRGTYAYGMRVRRVLLPDTGATLALAQPNGLRLYWHRRL
jgi:hypothetical protein